MSERRFPSPWSIEELNDSLVGTLCDASHIPNVDYKVNCRGDLLRGDITMSTITQSFMEE